MVALSHQLLAQRIHPGDTVVDATCGRGHDTLFLAQTVGEKGKVYAFDIQAVAIQSARALLNAHQALAQVSFYQADHSKMALWVQETISAAIFNLGYLPGGDEHICTLAHTTVSAIAHVLRLLAIGGILVIVAYPGRPAGKSERDAVAALLSSLSSQCWQVGNFNLINKHEAPCLFYVVKIKEEQE